MGCGIIDSDIDSDEDEPDVVTMEGTVASKNDGTPIPGAVVGTSIDGQTATTDGAGRFRLQTQARGNWCCTPYTVTVTAAGFETFSLSFAWGQRPTGQEFFLTPIP